MEHLHEKHQVAYPTKMYLQLSYKKLPTLKPHKRFMHTQKSRQ